MTTITRFTKEQLIARADHLLCVGKAFIAEHPEYDGMAKDVELFKIALASLEAEPVQLHPDIREFILDGINDATSHDCVTECDYVFSANLEKLLQPLYTAPPAPVSVPDEVNVLLNHLEDVLPDDAFNLIDVKTWNNVSMLSRPDVYRAAMLQGSQPVSNRDDLPLDYLQGHKDGLEWAAQLAEANHPQTGDWLYDDQTELAKAIRKGPDMPPVESGYSPVIPDCWCHTCRPVTMGDMRFVVCPECGNKRCPHANDHNNACTGSNEPEQEGSAYPAAPQQEVKS